MNPSVATTDTAIASQISADTFAGRKCTAAEKRAALTRDRDLAQDAAEAAERDLAAVEAELKGRRDVAAERKQLSLDLTYAL